jgi:hypothetical protein
MKFISQGHLTSPLLPGHTEGYTVLIDLDHAAIAKIRSYREAFVAAKKASEDLLYLTFPCQGDVMFFDEREGDPLSFDEEELAAAMGDVQLRILGVENVPELYPLDEDDVGIIEDNYKTIVVNDEVFYFIGHGKDDGYGDGRVANIRSYSIGYEVLDQ